MDKKYKEMGYNIVEQKRGRSPTMSKKDLKPKTKETIEEENKRLRKENLNNAYKQVYKNKGASGVDGVMVDELFSYFKEHKEEILCQIRNRKYNP